jgi:hypothetical protein
VIGRAADGLDFLPARVWACVCTCEPRSAAENLTGRLCDVLQGAEEEEEEAGEEAAAMAGATEQLLTILFDVQTYRAALLEFDIDPNLMPLGKLSRRHVEQVRSDPPPLSGTVCLV